MIFFLREYRNDVVVWSSSELHNFMQAYKALLHLRAIYAARFPNSNIRFELMSIGKDGEEYAIRDNAGNPEDSREVRT